MAPPITSATIKAIKTFWNEKEDHIPVFEQLCDFCTNIPKDLLKKWETPTGIKSLQSIVQDWAIILLGHQLCVRQPNVVTFVGALLLMTRGQRGLLNLAHDSVHCNLLANKRVNDFLANAFLASPLMTTADVQRKSHTAHHHYLGTNDPYHGLHNDTSMRHYRNGRFDHKAISSLFIYDFFDARMIINYTLGSLTSAPLHLSLYWSLLTLLFGWRFTFLFHLTRCTLSYACYILREIIDHSGLPSSTIIQFTRTSPCCNPLQKFLQPHDDNYHLLRHLLPRVPMSRLYESHLWLVENVPVYKKANIDRAYNLFYWGKPAVYAVVAYALLTRLRCLGTHTSLRWMLDVVTAFNHLLFLQLMLH